MHIVLCNIKYYPSDAKDHKDGLAVLAVLFRVKHNIYYSFKSTLLRTCHKLRVHLF